MLQTQNTCAMINETLQSLYAEYSIPSDHVSAGLSQLAETDSRYLKDLKLNLSAVLVKTTQLNPKETALLALATALNEGRQVLISGFKQRAINAGATPEEISEVYGAVSLMNANNVFYRFRHYLPANEFYNSTPAGLRMSIMMNPVLGKEFFELLSLGVSALNGCELCVTSHEASVKQQGASEARVFDAIRLVAVVKSFCALV